MAGMGMEMRRLMMAVSFSVILLVLAITCYFLVDVILTTEQNISDNKDKMIKESVHALEETRNILVLSEFNPAYLEIFNKELTQRMVAGDLDLLYDFAVKVALLFYPVEYTSIIKDGAVVSFGAQSGWNVDPSELPTSPPEGGYQLLDRLGDREGFFISVFNPVDLGVLGLEAGKIYANMIMDRTEELASIEDYFHRQRWGFLARLFTAAGLALFLSLLITTLGLRYFTRKYVTRPIEEINHQAREIMEGTFTGEVEIDERSAYAPLQALLRSGQKVLQRMEKEIGE